MPRNDVRNIKNVRLACRITKGTKTKLDKICGERGITYSQLIRNFIKSVLIKQSLINDFLIIDPNKELQDDS